MDRELFLKKEIILKEEEKYQLTAVGVIKNLTGIIVRTLSSYHEKQLEKTHFLHYFYTQIVGYATFINKQKRTNLKLQKSLFGRSKVYLESLKKQYVAPLDKDLKYNKISIGWFFPSEVFEDYYQKFCTCTELFEMPSAVEAFFHKWIDTDYPLSIRQYIRYLKDDLLSFWNVTCAYIKEIIQVVGKQVLFNPQQSAQTDLIMDTAWSDTYEILRSKLQQTDCLLSFDSGMDFRNYLIQITHYRLQNLRVKYTPKEESFDFYPDWEQEPEEETEMMDSCSVVDVDIQNAYEVAYAISIILLNPAHPLHKRLTQGIESKVDILIRKAVKGQTYSQIVEEKYNLYPENSCFNKTVVKTRKEYERLRKMLQDRFVELKKEQEKVSHPIYLSDNK